MKKISLSAVAILLACTTVFADGKTDKTTKETKKAKTECTCPSGKCVKDGKVVNCDPATCTDKANCHQVPCTDKCCS